MDPNDSPKDPELIGEMVGDYNYLPVVLVVIMKFCGRIGPDIIPVLYMAEIYPFR